MNILNDVVIILYLIAYSNVSIYIYATFCIIVYIHKINVYFTAFLFDHILLEKKDIVKFILRQSSILA